MTIRFENIFDGQAHGFNIIRPKYSPASPTTSGIELVSLQTTGQSYVVRKILVESGPAQVRK
jgi:hypothetical protein